VVARIVVIVAWIAALGLLMTWDATTPALIVAAAATVIAGGLVGRWWVLLVPVVPAVLLGLYVLIDGKDPGEWWDSEPITYAFAFGFAGAALAFLLAVGVALNRLQQR
jgi:hypothetical protein